MGDRLGARHDLPRGSVAGCRLAARGPASGARAWPHAGVGGGSLGSHVSEFQLSRLSCRSVGERLLTLSLKFLEMTWCPCWWCHRDVVTRGSRSAPNGADGLGLGVGIGAGSSSRWSGQVGIQEVSPRRWALLGTGPVRGVHLPTGCLSAKRGAVGFGVNSCRDMGMARCGGQGPAMPSPALHEPLGLRGFHRCL